uniref:Uncharacterized protein n=1 Tax=Opuntia streptacantha TaxID=393608 RepID=A0A7C8ZX01_OPUST
MQKLRALVVQEPVIAASCLIASVGVLLPIFKPMLSNKSSSSSFMVSSSNKEGKDNSPSFGDILAGVTGPLDHLVGGGMSLRMSLALLIPEILLYVLECFHVGENKVLYSFEKK